MWMKRMKTVCETNKGKRVEKQNKNKKKNI